MVGSYVRTSATYRQPTRATWQRPLLPRTLPRYPQRRPPGRSVSRKCNRMLWCVARTRAGHHRHHWQQQATTAPLLLAYLCVADNERRHQADDVALAGGDGEQATLTCRINHRARHDVQLNAHQQPAAAHLASRSPSSAESIEWRQEEGGKGFSATV
jgi:hypothetical protein